MQATHSGSIWGLSPFFVFLIVYLCGSLILGDFYAMPLPLAFVVAAIYAVAITRGVSFEKRIQLFTAGASDHNILAMIWIFILAGAFSSGAQAIGAIDATVDVLLSLLPSSLLLPSVFLVSCLISLSIGTSVGTIVALTPIVLGFSSALQIDLSYMCAIVVGGAFFGDNLSFISDTTIAATRSQGVRMVDKFRFNLWIALPAAFVCLVIYAVSGNSLPSVTGGDAPALWLLLPYLIVLGTALLGMNVLLVLVLGIVSCGIIGVGWGYIDLWSWIASLGKGITEMGELIIVTLLAGALLALIRYNGGIDFLLELLTRRIKGRRGGEAVIASLVAIANVCTANNTIAILSTGAVARDISARYQIDPRRTASLLDIFSCVVQGLLPYGAQLLLAAGFAHISPLSIVPWLYYPMLLGLSASIAIAIGGRKAIEPQGSAAQCH